MSGQVASRKIFFVLLFLLFGKSAHSGEPFSDQLIQTPKLEKPKRGSLKGDFAELGEKALNLTSGSFTIGLPISFPSDRGGMQKPYSASYSPGFGISEYGIGWSAGLKISRMKEIGKINFSTDDFMTPFGQMVEGSDGFYYSKDLRKKIKASLSGQEFTFYLPNGDVAIFGETSSSDYNDIHENLAVYTWYLKETSDKVGRKTLYTYGRLENNGKLYLDEISYGGLNSDYQYRIDFDYEETHRPFVDYSLGRIQIAGYRVAKISLLSNESSLFLERYHYDFNYSEEDEGPAFYLASMQKTYAGGGLEPPLLFDYDRPKKFLQTTNWQRDNSLDSIATTYNGIATLYAQTATVDFNLDGRPDLEIGQGYNRFVRTDTGYEPYDLPSPVGEVSDWCLFPVVHSRKTRKFMQFFGPSTQQYVYDKFEFNDKTILEVCLPNGEKIDSIIFPKNWHDNGTTLFHDINGDLLPDLVHLNGKEIQFSYNISTGGIVSFTAPTTPTYLNLPNHFHGFWIKDMNGDGHEDLVLKGDSAIYVHYGIAGGGFVTEYQSFDFYLPNGAINSRNIKNSSIIWVDANKDSLPDILLQFDGLLSLHLNSGLLFTQINVPGLFIGGQLLNNTMVADLGATGGVQLVSSVRAGGSDYYIQTLNLDRPGLGLLKSLNDGKGNSTSFTYGKSSAQEGVQNLKTIITKMTSHATGESDTVRDLYYGQVATHTLTKNFLGFLDTESMITGKGSSQSFYNFDDNNLQTILETLALDVQRPDVIRYSENHYSDITLAGISAPFLDEKKEGYRTANGLTKVEKTTAITTSGTSLCKTQEIVTGTGLNQTTVTANDSITSFNDHLSCLSKDQTLSSTGTYAFSHEIHFSRDSVGRVTKVEQGTSGNKTTIQDITYGSNGRLSTIDSAASGATSVLYDNNYRIFKITNPDGTQNQISEFEFLNDQPKGMKLSRDTEDFISYFRFDNLGRMNKQWDDLGGYSETTPQMSLNYVFATETKPGKIYQTINIEKILASFGSYVDVALETARGKALAGVIETNSNLKITGLTNFDNQALVTTIYKDHLISNATDLSALAMGDLNYNQDELKQESKEFLGGLLENLESVQTGVVKETDVLQTVLSSGLESKTTINANSNLETKNLSNEFGHVVKYTDEAGGEYFYNRDAMGRIREITFPDGIVQTVSYEGRFGKVSEIERDHIGKITYEYDTTTTLLNKKTVFDKNNLKNRTIDFTYDSIGRISQKTLKTYDAGGVVTETLDYDYKYDGINLDTADKPGQDGYLTGVESSKFKKKMVYRLDGKILKQVLIIPGEREFITTFEYFSQGDVKSKRERVLTEPGGVELLNYQMTYEYDRFGNLTIVKKGGNSFASFSYNSYNEVATAVISGVKDLKYFYDGTTRRLNDYREENGGTTLFKQVLNISDRGLITDSDYTIGMRTILNSYDYTDRGFLENQTQVDSGGTAKSHSYLYDQTSSSIYYGTLTSSQVNGGTAKAITIGASSWSVNGVSYGLDTLGRVISKGSKNFIYGVNGRIKEAKDGTTSLAQYFYDEEDNPILKEIAGGGVEIYLGDNIYAAGAFLEPVKIGNRVVGYFKDGSFVSSSQDHLNSSVLDESGGVNLVSPFGERSSRSEVSFTLDFTLKGFDSDIGAVRMGRRFYDPQAKRFLSPDNYFIENFDEVLGHPTSGNLYSYAGNNPISFSDPTGDVEYDNSSGSWSSNAGDSVGSIASDTGFSSSEIASVNPGLSNQTLMSGADVNIPQTKRVKTFQNAANSIGSTEYSYSSANGSFDANTNKCNQFCSNMVQSAGGSYPRHKFLGVIPRSGPARAGYMAKNSNTNTPRIGDVASWSKNYSDASGHSTIYSGNVNIRTSTGRYTRSNGGFISPGTNRVEYRTGTYMSSKGFKPSSAGYWSLGK